jgi:insulysin
MMASLLALYRWRRVFITTVLLVLVSACSSIDSSVAVTKPRIALAKNAVAVIKSPNDHRNYRALTLANGMQVLLISDPKTDRAAAAVSVAAGANSDPQEFQGLAHFLEHMLFMGTAKYPTAGEYQEFISSHGGGHNAFTSYQNTTFFFEIDGGYLASTLDRFSQFFIAPLFSEDYVSRERNAINSEFQSGLQDDGRRNQAVLKAIVNPQHPMAGFAVGNLQTLQDHGDTKLRAALLSHYDRYYSANLMSVSIFGRESLDQLELMAQQYFGPVVNKHRRKPVSSVPLFDKGTLPLQVNVATLRDTRTLSYSFPLPDMRQFYKDRPVDYLANVLGHEGEGSLLKVLRDLGWANALSAGSGFATEDVSIFSVNVALTEAGLTKVDEITALLFQYIAVIRNNGIQDWLYQELQTMAELAFQYQQLVGPGALVTSLVERLPDYPKQDLITLAYFYQKFDAKLIGRVLDQLRPDNMVITLSARNVPVTQKEMWYGTAYSKLPISAIRQQQWQQYPRNTALAVSAPNPFIPENLALKPRVGPPLTSNAINVREKPQLLVDADGVRLWFKQDNQFFTPRANFFVSALTPLFENSLRNSLLANFVVNLVNDQLSAYAYPANLAGASFGIGARSRGLNLAVNGFSDKQQELLVALLKTLTAANFEQERFDIIKAETIRNWQNTALQTPYVRLQSELQAMLVNPYWSLDENIAAAQTITLADVKAFVPLLLSNLHIDAMYHGNITQADAQAMLDLVKQYLHPVADSPMPGFGNVVDLPEQKRMVAEMTIAHDDSAIVIYQQAKDKDMKSRAIISLLTNLLNPPFFDSLRTQQQLGYVVNVETMALQNVNGLTFTIESPVADPVELEARINEFLQGYVQSLAAMPAQQFNGTKQGLLNELRQIPEGLDALSSRYWSDILSGDFTQDRALQMAEVVATLTQAEVVDYFRMNVADPKATRLVARSAGRAQQQAFTNKRKEPATTEVIQAGTSNYADFKANKPVFSYP